jgi:hypothetical protein
MLEQAYGTPGLNMEKHLLTQEILDVSLNSSQSFLIKLSLHCSYQKIAKT